MYDNTGPIIIRASTPEYVPREYTVLQLNIAERHIAKAIQAIRKVGRNEVKENGSYTMLLLLSQVIELIDNQS